MLENYGSQLTPSGVVLKLLFSDSIFLLISEKSYRSVAQGGLACCNSWGRKELDTTEQLN